MVSWQGKRVLVTGGAGFIGSHLAERLVQLGATVRVLAHYRSDGGCGWLDASPVRPDVELVLGDIRDRDSVRDAVRGRELVFHLAALVSVPDSYRRPWAYYDTIEGGTLNVLDACRASGALKALVHTSTSEVFGSARSVPMDEQHPISPQSPYADAKASADLKVMSWHRSYDIPAIVVRPFNAFGPRQSTRAIVPTIIGQCLAGGPVRLGNLYPTRDLNYVADTVEGFVKAAECEAAIGRVINIGSGREISVGDLLGLIVDMVGCHAVLALDRERIRPESSEVDRLLCDNRLAKSLLGWQPRYTLEDGLRATIEWMEEHRGNYRPAAYAI